MLTRKQQELLLFIHARLLEGGVSPSFDEMKDALGLKSKSGIHRLIGGLEERGFIRRLPHRARALEVLRLPEPVARSVPMAGASAGASAAPQAPALGTPPQAANAPPPREGDRRGASSPPAVPFRPNVIKGDFRPGLAGRETRHDVGAVNLPLYGRIAAGLPIEALRDQTNTIDFPTALLGTGEHYALEVAGDSMVDAGIMDGDTVIIQRCEQAESGTIVVALVDEAEVTLKRLRRKGNSIALEPANPAYETRVFGSDRVRIQGRLVALLRRY